MEKVGKKSVEGLMKRDPFDTIDKCSDKGRSKQTVVSDLDGTLLRSRSSFPYFMLVAFEAGGVARAFVLLLCSPLCWLLYHCVSESIGIRLLIFVTFAGLKIGGIEAIARGTLPKFYAEDVHPDTWRIFSSFGERYILTATPRIMAETFAKTYLGVDGVLGTELHFTSGGIATGLLMNPGVLTGRNKEIVLRQEFQGLNLPDVGLGDRPSDHNFMSICKEGYIVPPSNTILAASKESLMNLLVFHDGRLIQRPTAGIALIILLWYPIGAVLAVLRILAGILLPFHLLKLVYKFLGVGVVVRGTPPPEPKDGPGRGGYLYVCSHRTLLDPVMVGVALKRRVTAVTYSISRLSEVLSPIKTVALKRNREKDAAKIRSLLREGDLAICPEGTTCREPYLLRFSALFAELSNQLVPVAMNTRMSMFHGTTAQGWKCLDPFYFFMNPNPIYEVTFLNELPVELTCAGGKSSYEVANHIQQLLSQTLGFECTNYTRKDKYGVLCGNDGSIPLKSQDSFGS
ncbi:glycerol-3-phosphate 2-O-acyltransferase 6 [Physcomitrium patens]|uniref:glycerol-3-phosphate 2-O-acyltransferase 6 n=1 Tax=Physcomitrium patens TaxID=3218 RepID=UPI000D150B39|nr:glycerol-3-phosphate 2-O-acyltransferase 6-like [Physcomitrium patens]XP_024378599.1 glycerol-3-phosphate 2-O-acyltransferase 6-like [Physcomitrium patens]XP_024378600.1 glycerol-3-phosphate 2-O-acyltransferase 6-like [Physcomitrium patens]XP_024378601.1 glycerol-3-phosphate 2-O-acyltransferase 6-like [Physcomitrium patens]XP_024378603.1 glycerol-3-phosphate 2-O-acyltransferase 6-like [Physcomitrium patens]XP_024378604.1 glycerol-3-phosphate 2-O-acyltransferase 6-like [Physcomitrium patens]|eukprot:XP_024378598.1 glycerol-3-phosphate 2-O-acyltransferase 6-like [Physcomitrella patens]